MNKHQQYAKTAGDKNDILKHFFTATGQRKNILTIRSSSYRLTWLFKTAVHIIHSQIKVYFFCVINLYLWFSNSFRLIFAPSLVLMKLKNFKNTCIFFKFLTV